MNKKRILIVEDEFLIALDIETNLKKNGYDVVGIAKSFEEAISYSNSLTPDLVLMDIFITGTKTGIDAAEYIYNRFNIPIVFLTASSDHATFEKALLVNPFGFVLKPFVIDDLIRTIEIALKKHSENYQVKSEINQIKSIITGKTNISDLDSGSLDPEINNDKIGDSMFIKTKSKLIRIEVSDILWVEAMDNYSVIITENKSKLVVNMFLKQLNEKLPEDKFIRIHRSYIVALDRIERIEENQLFISNKALSVGKSYKKDLMDKLDIF